MKIILPALSVSLLLLCTAFVLLPPAHAQSGLGARFNLPPSTNAGAILNHDIYNFYVQRNQPYVNRPMTRDDVVGQPVGQAAPVTIEPGVIPRQNSVKGLLVTPSGKVIITNSENH